MILDEDTLAIVIRGVLVGALIYGIKEAVVSLKSNQE